MKKLTIFENLYQYFCLHRKFLILNLVQRNLKLKYRKSILGVFWSLLVPLASAAVYFAVFKFVMKVNIPNYLLFVMTGILPWTFFATTVSQGMESIVSNSTILNKVPIPAQSFPLSESLTSFTNLILSIPAILIVIVITGASWSWLYLLGFFFLLTLFIQSYSIALILSIWFVHLRDLRHILNIILQIWFYVTPVIYSAEMLPAGWEWLLYANPVAFNFTGLHDIMIFQRLPDPTGISILAIWTIGLLILSLAVHLRSSSKLAESI